MLAFAAIALALFSRAQAHCNSLLFDLRSSTEVIPDTFPSLIVGGKTTPAWTNVRQTNNFNSQAPVCNHFSLLPSIDAYAHEQFVRSPMSLARISDAMTPPPPLPRAPSALRRAPRSALLATRLSTTPEYVGVLLPRAVSKSGSCLLQVVNVYMAKAPNGNVSSFAGDGAVWFKVYEITPVTNGGSSISFPAQSERSISEEHSRSSR